jgi:integration host factor subunit beta
LDLVDTQNYQEDTMNKVDLINALRDEAKLTKPEAKAVVNLFFNEMADALATGDSA